MVALFLLDGNKVKWGAPYFAGRTIRAAEQAYKRSDALDKRRKLMEDWAVFLVGEYRQ